MELILNTEIWYLYIKFFIFENKINLNLFYFQGGWTALIWSSYCGYTNLANLLLDRGADINAHGNFHITALVWAAGRGHTKLACNLIARGAKVNVGDKACIKTM